MVDKAGATNVNIDFGNGAPPARRRAFVTLMTYLR
jgi:hypothetical protein